MASYLFDDYFKGVGGKYIIKIYFNHNKINNIIKIIKNINIVNYDNNIYMATVTIDRESLTELIDKDCIHNIDTDITGSNDNNDNNDNETNTPEGFNILHLLASFGMTRQMKKLAVKLINKIGVNCKDKDNVTPLLVSCYNNYFDNVKFFVENKAHVNIKTKEHRRTPLFAAESVEIVEYLLDNGSYINTRDIGDNTRLIYACEVNIELVKLLLKKKANVNMINKHGKNALFYASSLGIVKLLIDNKIKIDIVSKDGRNPLFAARDVDSIKMLVEQKCDINAVDNNGKTLLNMLVGPKDNKYCEAISYVLDIIDPKHINWKDTYGDNLLAFSYSMEITKILVEHGVDINNVNNDGYNAIIFCNTVDKMEYLVANGCDTCPNGKSQLVKIILDKEEYKYGVERILYLIENCDVNICDNGCRSPLQKVIYQSKSANPGKFDIPNDLRLKLIHKILEKPELDINYIDNTDNDTALTIAAFRMKKNLQFFEDIVFKLLKIKGIKCDNNDNNGKTAFDYAFENGCSEKLMDEFFAVGAKYTSEKIAIKHVDILKDILNNRNLLIQAFRENKECPLKGNSYLKEMVGSYI